MTSICTSLWRVNTKRKSPNKCSKCYKTTHKNCQLQSGMRWWVFVNSNKDVKIDFKSAFKSVWVTKGLDGSEDYLVSDKIFGFVGESLTSFGTEMIAKPPPKTVKERINSMIPPKGIKRGKNIAGTELLDGEEIREWFIGGRRWWKWRCRWLLVALSGNIPIETTSHETVKESNSVIGKTVIMSLVGITDSEDIEKDARFLGELRKVFESFETSTQFTSASQKIETAYQNTRRVLKKRIKNKVCLGNHKCASMEKKVWKLFLRIQCFLYFNPPGFIPTSPIINF